MTALALPFHVFWYEDFVDDYAPTSASLLNALDVSVEGALLVAPRIRKQGQTDDPFIPQFLDALGVAR